MEEPLGAGAFGEVYKARDPDLEKSVAIKKLKAQHSGNPVDTRLLFTKEAVETSKLSHPNIVTVHGFGIDENDRAPYLVMEFLEGQTLESVISRKAARTLVEKMEIMQQVAEGLQFAHTRGVRHRDIKPANIMLLSDGTAKVLDFAVAPEGYVVGTPAYMAPEQFAGQSSDVFTDIFSYGTVYYELVTGERAYDPNRKDRAQASPYEPPRLATCIPDCPGWLDDVVSHLMKKRREDRIESLEDMLLYTRPILQKLKQERAAELAAGLPALMSRARREEADSLIDTILRLDPLNRQARDARSGRRADQRGQARARAQENARAGQAYFAAGDFAKAQRAFEDAQLEDPDAADVARFLFHAKAKADDQRSANRLLDEVLDYIIDAGPERTLAPFQLASVIEKLNRATSLDPRCSDAMELRLKLLPLYEAASRKRMEAAVASGVPNVASDLYERRLRDAQIAHKKARVKEEYDYAELVLRNLLTYATDDRAIKELGAVLADREARIAANHALQAAADLRARSNYQEALQVLSEYAVHHPRHAMAVQEPRKALEKELGMRDGVSELEAM